MEKSERNKNIKILYEKALKHYFNTEFSTAQEIFKKLWVEYEDYPSKILLERSEYYIKNPPEEGWEGIYEFKEK